MPLRILVADDHDVMRLGIKELLGTREGWEICAEARDGREALAKTGELSRTLSSWTSTCRS